MRYRELTQAEQEAYNVGYRVGNRQIIITDIEWESETEHKIYRKGYMAGLMDFKRKNVSNVSTHNNVSNVSNVHSYNSDRDKYKYKYKVKDVDKDKVKDKVKVRENNSRNNTTKSSTTRASKQFVPPTVDQVKDYCKQRGNNIDPETFVAFYESKGWKVGSQPMRSWQAAIITWEKRHRYESAPADLPV